MSKPVIIIACLDGYHEYCSSAERGTNRPCECACHAANRKGDARRDEKPP
jgi:hypothetical protein